MTTFMSTHSSTLLISQDMNGHDYDSRSNES